MFYVRQDKKNHFVNIFFEFDDVQFKHSPSRTCDFLFVAFFVVYGKFRKM
jgi:hypothetical protein